MTKSLKSGVSKRLFPLISKDALTINVSRSYLLILSTRGL
jgi:hypothetical protein